MAEDARRLVLELRTLQAQAEDAQRQLSAIQAFSSDATTAISALKNVPSTKDEALFPIGAGAFVKAKVTDSQNVLLDIGAGVVAEKTVPEAIAWMEVRISQLNAAGQRIQEELQALLARGDELNARLAQASRERGPQSV